MQQWMRTRAIRTVGLLFGLSLMLTACDPADFFAFFGGGAADDAPPAAEEVVDEGAESDSDDPVTEESDPVSEGSEPVSGESDPVSGDSEPVVDEDEEPGSGSRGEHQCFRDRDGGAEADQA